MSDLLFSFSGRVGRTEWWVYRFGAMFFGLVIFIALGSLLGQFDKLNDTGAPTSIAFIIFSYVLLGVVLWIDLAIAVKRWHDRGKSGFWILIGLIPLIGGLWVLVECGFLPGDPELNKYDGEQEDIAEAFS